MTIEFRLEDPTYGFLSNFYPYSFMDKDGIIWKTSEHYYQAMKTINLVERGIIWNAPLARDAKKLGKTITLRAQWNSIKEDVMLTVLLYKFSIDSPLSSLLLATGDKELVEWAPWDSYWGAGRDGKGQNRLGILLMDVRSKLREDLMFT